MKDEIMKTELPEREYTGFCRFCGQARIVHAPDGWKQDQIDECASAECDCEGASFERKQLQRLEAAVAWASNMFEEEGKHAIMVAAINAVFSRAVKAISVTADTKNTYKVAMDSNDMLRIRKEFREQDEEEF
ncbi:MAG: hypothetical protein IJ110_01545 [Lachnospiraceae bacterium]|nr:hypothetical protein [Lachnospiraceae bacterium]